MIIALAASLTSNFDILKTFASLLARHIFHINLNFCKENNKVNNNRFKEFKHQNNKVVQNNITNNHNNKSSPIITLENTNTKEINIPQDNSISSNSEIQITINNNNEKEDIENNDKKEDTDNNDKKEDNNCNTSNNDNNTYSRPLSHDNDKQQFLNFCAQVENRIKSSNQFAESNQNSNQKIGKRKRNENKKEEKFVNLEDVKNSEQNNLDIYDSDVNKNNESSDKLQGKKNKLKELNKKIILLTDIKLNTPIDLEDLKNPFNGVEYIFRYQDNNKLEFWESKFKPNSSEVKSIIRREFSIKQLGFQNAKFLAMKYNLLVMMENKYLLCNKDDINDFLSKIIDPK